jgi:hypothetical protein
LAASRMLLHEMPTGMVTSRPDEIYRMSYKVVGKPEMDMETATLVLTPPWAVNPIYCPMKYSTALTCTKEAADKDRLARSQRDLNRGPGTEQGAQHQPAAGQVPPGDAEAKEAGPSVVEGGQGQGTVASGATPQESGQAASSKETHGESADENAAAVANVCVSEGEGNDSNGSVGAHALSTVMPSLKPMVGAVARGAGGVLDSATGKFQLRLDVAGIKHTSLLSNSTKSRPIVTYMEQDEKGRMVAIMAAGAISLAGEGYLPDQVLVDSGANVDIITKQKALEHGLCIEPYNSSVQTSSGARCAVAGIVRNVTITLCKGDPSRESTVVTDLTVLDASGGLYDLLLGTPFMRAAGMMMDFATGLVGYRVNWQQNSSWDSVQDVVMIPMRRSVPAACSLIAPVSVTASAHTASGGLEQSTQTEGHAETTFITAPGMYTAVPPPSLYHGIQAGVYDVDLGPDWEWYTFEEC